MSEALISEDVILGSDVKVYGFSNLYGCSVGDRTRIGTFVEVQRGASIGRDCKVSSHTFICEGVTIEDEVFVGHNVTFINDRYPRATNGDGTLQTGSDWAVVPTRVCTRASIGSSATILCGVTIGEGATVGAGSVVTRDVAPHTIVAGNPARAIRRGEGGRSMGVPFLDLKAQYESIQHEIDPAIGRVVRSSAFAGGKYVTAFEEEFARYCGVQFAIGVGSGTEALWFALLALGVGPGDEVITVPNTFIATVEAITFTGASPVFVDVDESTALMDPALLEAVISPRTRAIIPVHLYGQTADMDPILEIAGRHGIPVVEDAAQAHGARYRGRPAGSMGIAGCFSFYPGKNLGAYGEAGAITTNDPNLAKQISMLRDHGQSSKYHHDLPGWNGRMDGIQGAVLSVKLRHLDAWNAARQLHAAQYRELLQNVRGVRLIRKPESNYPVYHVLVVRVADRERVMAALGERGIGCGIHYPVPIHLTDAYRDLALNAGAFPASEQLAGEVLSLPMFAEITGDQIETVCEVLAAAVTEAAQVEPIPPVSGAVGTSHTDPLILPVLDFAGIREQRTSHGPLRRDHQRRAELGSSQDG